MSSRGLGLARIVVNAVSAILVLFHGVLLWERLVDGTVLEPAVAGEWLVGLLLLLGLVRLYRGASSRARKRSALVLWLLVLLLHAVAVAPVEGASFEVAVDRNLLLTIPFGLAIGGAFVRAVELIGRLRSGAVTLQRREALYAVAIPVVLPGISSSASARAPPLWT